MQITDIKINGYVEPIGVNLPFLNISFVIKNGNGKPVFLEIYQDSDKLKPVFKTILKEQLSCCHPILFKPEKGVRYIIKFIAEGELCGETFFETAEDLDSPFITPIKEISHPIIFKTFTTEKEIGKARLYVTGVGLYEAYLNGKKVGNEFLTPSCNDYDEYLQYQTYDVTEYISNENLLEILLGNGWYKGRFGLKHKENIFGSEYATSVKVVVVYKDGSIKCIVTDDTWQAKESTILSSGIYDGETIDDNKVAGEIIAVKYLKKKFNVTERTSLPIVIKEKIRPTLIETKSGCKILDFKQNFAGFVSFKLHLKKGEKLRLVAGEVLQNGEFYNENLRSAMAEFVYVSDGTEKEIRPHFTFYGFRYMLVEGLSHIDTRDFIGNVLYSDLSDTIDISTDNEKINKLLKNCKWGQRSNFLDVPTDCPQRDERLGWTGDAEVFSKTACYQMDCKAFYAKYLTDVAIDQRNYGGVTGYSPAMKEGSPSGSVWSDAATIIPWTVYMFYADVELLKNHFPMMEKHVQSILEEDNKRGGHRLYNFGSHLGDWLSQDGVSPSALKGATDEFFISSAYYYQSALLTAKAAKVLGFTDKAQYYLQLSKHIRRAILKEYFTPSGRLSVDTQTAYTLCVVFDIYKNKEKLVAGFAERLKRDSYKIKGGFVGATQLIQALISCNLTEEAFRILYNEQYPGWLYCVNLGATTIWERWNSLNSDGSMSGTGMNSLNHYSFGAVAEAFYAYIAGIRPLVAGFKKVLIEPKFNYRLQKLNCTYRSVSGTFKIAYKCGENDKITLELEIPYGAKAVFRLEGKEDKLLESGSYRFVFDCPVKMSNPYSANVAVCDLIANEQTANVIKKYIPLLYQFLSKADMGLSGETLRNITSMESFTVPQDKMELIECELKAIKI